jgi:hypothetical protein
MNKEKGVSDIVKRGKEKNQKSKQVKTEVNKVICTMEQDTIKEQRRNKVKVKFRKQL